MSAPDLQKILRRHERTTRIIFGAFAAAALAAALLILTADAWWPHRHRLALADDRFLAGTLFIFGVFNVVVSAAIRMFMPVHLRTQTDPANVANAATGCAVLALVLCETPVLFGLIYVLAGGETRLAAFFAVFALTCMAAHYVARIRP